ncbi:hypothetical protein LTR56_020232 [Elasticomyces elasticus]|nr:hypothetical protein LTR56_020232 [Elasticomyces elasticus]KAK3633443.1 hypothetical protein LTR22_020119 [Elasticomyces elasticus]KAK4907425.1 hypothetical protein LTR49_023528 [Elasticomyces elasticus]KAK5747833.1 hypothetical protein LTS12_022090 [Elasticomyces elasticus]
MACSWLSWAASISTLRRSSPKLVDASLLSAIHRLAMSATATTTTVIPLNTLPPARAGGPAATTLPANNAAPAANNVANAVGNTPARPPAHGPRKSIVPTFKASTWLGMALAAAAIAVTVYYGQVMLRLARWSAGNDFRGSCVDDRSIGISSSACNSTLSEPARPPPILRKRTLLVATVYGLDTDYAVTIAVTVTAGVALLTARYTLFRRHMESRPLPVISSARTNNFYEEHPRKSLVNIAVLQRPRNQHWVHDTWDDSDAEEAQVPYTPNSYWSSDDEETIDGSAGLHTVPDDTASIYMVVRDVHPSNSDTEGADTTREGTTADNVEDDGLRLSKGSRHSVLSEARQRARTAVLLDRVQNFEAAVTEYTEASRLLQHVIDQSTLATEKEKLQFIKMDYTVRITELEELERLKMARKPTSDENDLKFQLEPTGASITFAELDERRPSQTRDRANSQPLEHYDSTKAVNEMVLNDTGSSHLDTSVRPEVPLRFPRWCRALYAWTGERGTDLSLDEGDLIQVVNDACDGLWWEGKLLKSGGFTGQFPSNFVEVLDENFGPHKIGGFPLPPGPIDRRLINLNATVPVEDYRPSQSTSDQFNSAGWPADGTGLYSKIIVDKDGKRRHVVIDSEAPSLRRRLSGWVQDRRDPLSVASSTASAVNLGLKVLAMSGKFFRLPIKSDPVKAAQAAKQAAMRAAGRGP